MTRTTKHAWVSTCGNLGAAMALSLAVILVSIAFSATAEANRKGSTNLFRRVVVLDFGGPKAARARERVINVVENQGFSVLSRPKRGSQALNLGSERAMVNLAYKLRASAFVTGHVARKGSHWTAHMEVINGENGQLLGSYVVKSRSHHQLYDKVEGSFWKELGPDILDARIPRKKVLRKTRKGSRTKAMQERVASGKK